MGIAGGLPGSALFQLALTTRNLRSISVVMASLYSRSPRPSRAGDRFSARRRRLLHLDRDLIDLERLFGLAALRAGRLERLQGVLALGHFAKDRVLAIEPRRRDKGEEELAA